jgi:hypothetical protein
MSETENKRVTASKILYIKQEIFSFTTQLFVLISSGFSRGYMLDSHISRILELDAIITSFDHQQ